MATTLLSMVGSRTSADRKTGLLWTLSESLMASSLNIGMCWRTKRPGPNRKAVCRCSARNSRNEGALPCNVAGSWVTTRSVFRKAIEQIGKVIVTVCLSRASESLRPRDRKDTTMSAYVVVEATVRDAEARGYYGSPNWPLHEAIR